MTSKRSSWDAVSTILANGVGLLVMVWGVAFLLHWVGDSRAWWTFPLVATGGIVCWAGGWLIAAIVYVLITKDDSTADY